jgi:hypothetical protein
VTWFKVDDRFHSHPKVLALRAGQHEETAIALWVKAGSWCASNLTDGAVPTYVLNTLVRRNAEKAAAELVRVGLWETADDGFRFRSWDEYQPTKDAVESRRRKNAEKVATWRDRNRAGDPPCNQVTGDGVTAPVTLPPSRPVPISSLRSESVAPDTRQMVRFAFGEWYLAKNAVPWPIAQSKPEEVRAIADWIDQVAASENLEQTAVLERVMRNFSASEFVQSADKPWAVFAKSFADYWNAPKPKIVAQKPGSNAAIGRGRIVS